MMLRRLARALDLAVVAVLFCAVAKAAVERDRVPDLPGLAEGTPAGLDMFSGYLETALPAGGSAWTHYWLFAPKRPERFLVWQQGGPGGSSLIGLLTEIGPLTLNDRSLEGGLNTSSGEIPQVFTNPWGWHDGGRNALLFIEHPAPTGFSFCLGPDGEPDTCAHDDETQAELAYANYVTFFTKMYPEFAHLPLYFTGESYAGVLVPTVVLLLLRRRDALNADQAPWSVRGFALGNDCPGNHVFTCTPYSGWAGAQVSLDFLYGHGMVPAAKKAEIDAACLHWYVAEPPGPVGPPPPECARLLEDPVRPAKSVAGDTYDMGGGYFLYDTCGADLLYRDAKGAMRSAEATRDNKKRPRRSDEGGKSSGEYECGQENAATLWLNEAAVKEALHVRLVGKAKFALSTELNYTFTAASLLGAYNSTLIRDLRILQYSGDADPCVPYVGTEKWVDALRMPVADKWRPWTAPGTMAVTGYVTRYTTAGGGFTFATVRDAGHMMPRYKPKQALYMISNWLDGHDI